MNKSGFWLTSLTLTGSSVPPAEINFRNGLNVISGPSDTGKTFIAQCINFILGGSKTPENGPEAALYELASVGLRRSVDNLEMTLERSLRGGDLRLSEADQDARNLGAKHQPGETDTVSHLFLSLSGLAGKSIQTNKKGKTRQMSFRDIARLIIVDEEKIIAKISPIFSGQYTGATAEKSVFRLLLTGVDDSSVIVKKESKVTRSQKAAKEELIDDLIEQVRKGIAEIGIPGDPTSIRQQLERLDALFEQASAELYVEQQAVGGIEKRRREAWIDLRQVESRMDVLSELQGRFKLLDDQYHSDLRRLEAISETGFRLGQLKEVRCPVCGALPEHHDQQHQEPDASPESVATACHAEALKIHALLADLESTLAENAGEIERLGHERNQKHTVLVDAGAEIRDRLAPRVQAALQKLRESQTKRDKYRQILPLYERLEELQRIREETSTPVKSPSSRSTTRAVGTDEAEQFSQEVEALLRSWHFPNLDRVTFSEEDQDLIISGRRRSSRGKGVRAVTHAAFNLALLKYCTGRSMPHPGLVLLDSPLVVYREPDPDEQGFAPGLKDAFYRSLAADFTDWQIIILENEDPPEDIEPNSSIIRFTGTASGRRGFIPD